MVIKTIFFKRKKRDKSPLFKLISVVKNMFVVGGGGGGAWR